MSRRSWYYIYTGDGHLVYKLSHVECSVLYKCVLLSLNMPWLIQQLLRVTCEENGLVFLLDDLYGINTETTRTLQDIQHNTIVQTTSKASSNFNKNTKIKMLFRKFDGRCFWNKYFIQMQFLGYLRFRTHWDITAYQIHTNGFIFSFHKYSTPA